MNDEVSVTELDRERWAESPYAERSRFRVVMVMLAVVLGCGLAALLVHIGSEQQRADGPNSAVFNLPHGPTGGLAGGGVPASDYPTEVTGTSTRITVTNEAPPTGSTGFPWTHHRKPSTITVTQAPSQPRTTDSAAPPPPPTSGGNGGAPVPPTSSPVPPSSSTSPPPPCILGILLC
ncbi:MAG TPA: hypothetical protein VFG87_04980 [Amycolatopsis sp.]|nr:hypothetical protein [Amycolatopsis sp.]